MMPQTEPTLLPRYFEHDGSRRPSEPFDGLACLRVPQTQILAARTPIASDGMPLPRPAVVCRLDRHTYLTPSMSMLGSAATHQGDRTDLSLPSKACSSLPARVQTRCYPRLVALYQKWPAVWGLILRSVRIRCCPLPSVAPCGTTAPGTPTDSLTSPNMATRSSYRSTVVESSRNTARQKPSAGLLMVDRKRSSWPTCQVCQTVMERTSTCARAHRPAPGPQDGLSIARDIKAPPQKSGQKPAV
jgi:hypothetical protein